MANKGITLALVGCLIILLPTATPARTFTDASGRKVEAKMVRYYPSTASVSLQFADGSKRTVHLSNLSTADRGYIQRTHKSGKPTSIVPWQLEWDYTLAQTIVALKQLGFEGKLTLYYNGRELGSKEISQINTLAEFRATAEEMHDDALVPEQYPVTNKPVISMKDYAFVFRSNEFTIEDALFYLRIEFCFHEGAALLESDLAQRQAKELTDLDDCYLPLYLSSIDLFSADSDRNKQADAFAKLAQPLTRKYAAFFTSTLDVYSKRFDDGSHALVLREMSMSWSRAPTPFQEALRDRWQQYRDNQEKVDKAKLMTRDQTNLFTSVTKP